MGGKGGKSGGIKFAKNENELREAVKALLNSKVRGGLTVTKVLVEDMINIDRELYVSIALDRSQRAPVLIASAEGGVEIESVPKEKIFTRRIDPLIGYSDYIGREATAFMGLQGDVASQFRDILSKLYRVFNGEDCELVEINPPSS